MANNLHKPRKTDVGKTANVFGRKWNLTDNERPIGAHYNGRYGYLTVAQKRNLAAGKYDGNAFAIAALAAYAEKRRIEKTVHHGRKYHARDFTSVGYRPIGK